MDFKQRQQLVRRISMGKIYSLVKYNSNEYNVVFTDPSLDISYEADHIYQLQYAKHIESDVFTLEESYDILKKDGIWTNSMEFRLKNLELDLSNANKQLPKFKFQKGQQRILKSAIENIKKDIAELSKIKYSLWTCTAEYLSERLKRRFVLSKITSGVDQKLLENQAFLDCLCIYYYDENQVSDKELRELARTNPWRLYWTVSKETGTSLFPHSSVEMTELQTALVNWTQVYDFAYHSTNRPSDDVINDDDQFDNWYTEEIERLEKESNKVGDQYGTGQEIYIMADKEGAQDVYNLNDIEGRNRIAARQKKINEKGVVNYVDLPDVKRDIIMMANRSKNG